MIWKIAFRNLFRNARRTALTAGAVWIAVSILILSGSLLRGIEESTADVQIKTDTGLLRLAAAGYFETADDWELTRVLGAGEGEALVRAFTGEFPGARAVERIAFRADVTDGRFTTRARGLAVDPGAYFAAMKLTAVEGVLAPAAGKETPPLWMGAGLAEDFGVKVGGYFTLTARTKHGSYTAESFVLRGIVEAGNPIVDYNSVYIPLDRGRALLDMAGESTDIVMTGARRKETKRFADWVAERHPALDTRDWWEETRPIRELNGVRRKALRVLLGGILLIALSGIANTMLIACFERKKEIGMIKALGLSTGGLVRMILAEGVMIGILGAALGFSTAWPLCLWLEKRGLDLSAFLSEGGSGAATMASHIFFQPTPTLALQAFLTGVAVAGLATLYPAWRFARTHPLEALR